MLSMEAIKACCSEDKMVLTEHLLTRMRQRGIRLDDIRNALTHGEIIEQYPSDYPYPSGLVNAENLHVVCSVGDGYLYIITAYRPSAERWEAGGRERKEKTL